MRLPSSFLRSLTALLLPFACVERDPNYVEATVVDGDGVATGDGDDGDGGGDGNDGGDDDDDDVDEGDDDDDEDEEGDDDEDSGGDDDGSTSAVPQDWTYEREISIHNLDEARALQVDRTHQPSPVVTRAARLAS